MIQQFKNEKTGEFNGAAAAAVWILFVLLIFNGVNEINYKICHTNINGIY